jgi:hypothetical protein
LDLAAWEELKPTLGEAARVRRPLILDLSKCSAIDSFGLRVIFRVYREHAAGDPSVPMAIVVGYPATRLISSDAIGLTVPLFPALEQALAWIEHVMPDPRWRGGGEGGHGFARRLPR